MRRTVAEQLETFGFLVGLPGSPQPGYVVLGFGQISPLHERNVVKRPVELPPKFFGAEALWRRAGKFGEALLWSRDEDAQCAA